MTITLSKIPKVVKVTGSVLAVRARGVRGAGHPSYLYLSISIYPSIYPSIYLSISLSLCICVCIYIYNLNLKGWNSQVLRGFPRNLESTNLSRDNCSREIGRNPRLGEDNASARPVRPPALAAVARLRRPNNIDRIYINIIYTYMIYIYIYIYTYIHVV